jgi:hypothetical protein
VDLPLSFRGWSTEGARGWNRHAPEEIVGKLREVNVLVFYEKTSNATARSFGVSQTT